MEKEQNNVEESNVDESTTSNEEQNYEQDDSTGESEGAEEAQSDHKPNTETSDQRLARLKRQYERELKKQGKEGGQESRKESEESGQKEGVDEKYLKLDLKTEGIKDAKEQEVVLSYIREAKLVGRDVDVATALQSPVVREDLDKIRRTKSVPKPSNRTNGGASNSAEYYAAQIKKGAMRLGDVPDAAMRKELTRMRIF